MERKNILDNKRIGRLLIQLSLPAFIGMSIMSLYNVVDTIFIGYFVGSLGIAALGIVFPVQMIAGGIGLLMGIGGASLISRLIGANDLQGAKRILGNAVFGTFIISVILIFVGFFWIDTILVQMGASETILPFARDYMKIILAGLLFRIFAFLLHTLIRAEGNARIPMMGMIIGAILNILLDIVFIVWLGFGIKGAALATIAGETASVLYFFRFYFSGQNFLHLELKNLILRWHILGSILSIGVSAFAMQVATSISIVFVNKMCLKYGGDMSVSAFGIINRIIIFAQMPAAAISMGLQPIVGFNYGAKYFERILRAISISAIISTGFCIIAFFLLSFFPEPVISIFTPDETLVALSAHAIKRVFSAFYFVGLIFIGSTVFQALGKVSPAFITSVARAVIFLIPLLFFLPRFFQLDGVWWALPLSDMLAFILTALLIAPQIRSIRKSSRHSPVGDCQQ